MTADPKPPLSAFPHHTTEKLRFSDTDMVGHINNAVYATLIEAARVNLFYQSAAELAPTGTTFVIAKLSIDFLAELKWPTTVTIGTRVTRLGTSSLDLEHAIFSGDHCAARGLSTGVLIDTQTRRGTPLSPQARAYLETLMGAAGSEPLR
ncbi:MAG: thioesterase family protein [Pseudomonadota bacterium]